MSLTQLSSTEISKISKLVETKERLLGQIADLDAQIESIASGSAPATKPAKARKTRARKTVKAKAKKVVKAKAKAKPGKRGSKGALKDKIMAALESAGAKGIRVKELATTLKVKPANISVWFYTTGAKNKSIKKIAPATYALTK